MPYRPVANKVMLAPAMTWKMTGLNAVAAVQMYERASPDERQRIKRQVCRKINYTKTLSVKEKKDLRRRVLEG